MKKKLVDPYTGETLDVLDATEEVFDVLEAAQKHPEVIQDEIDKEIISKIRAKGFRVGDTVRSKNPNGQVKISGRIVGLLDAEFYVHSMLNKNGQRVPFIDPDVIWGKTCPYWRKELVAIVFFNIPQRSATKEEWVESGVRQGWRKEDCEANYERQCPMIQEMVLPVNDLVEVGE